MKTKTKILLILTPLLVLVDQVTKFWVYFNLEYGKDEITVIPGFLSIVHAQNPGAAMGMLVDFEHRIVLFLIFTVVAIAVLWNMYKQLPDEDRFQSTTIALILSGALGNVIDRLHKQTVTDFIKMYVEWDPLEKWLIANLRTNEWPTYNVADAAIVVGVGMYLVHYLFFEKDRDGEDPGRSPLEADDERPADAGR